jgi:NTP pyrophosphatase (non-canonical NTP hydrolase)
MDLATIQGFLRHADSQLPNPFRSAAERVIAITEELGEVATEVALLERIGTKASWSREPSREHLTTELVHLLNTLIGLANHYQIDLDTAYTTYMRQSHDAHEQPN